MKSSTGEPLERVNIMLQRTDSEWLDSLVTEMQAETGSRISRSEIVRAAISGIRELDRLAKEGPSRVVPLTKCRSGEDLAIMTVLAARLATSDPGGPPR
jgi:hypothetical protein